MASVHKLLLAVLLGFLFTAIPGPAVIRFLKRMDFRQSERQEGPPSHQKKAGTPTVGGVFLLLGWLLASLIGVREGFSLVLPVLLVTVLCGLMGFLDDFIKISTGTSMGLLPYQKVLLQFVVSLLAAAWLYRSDAVGSAITLPFSGKSWDLDFFYIPFALFVLMGTMNGVNLTDGVDGLAAGTSLVVQLCFVILFALMPLTGGWTGQSANYGGMSVYAAAGAGALMGFLLFNAYPARIFMGDTGSLALGGAIAMEALVSKSPLLLPLMAIPFVLSVLSVMIQVGSYKFRKGKRVFKMAPLHHHFELLGVSEPKITALYMLLTGVCCALSIYIFTK
ncbi:MAG: phospho-N-acetylmuramoyl-pentapeptide-transferase [Clostridia bacterium]|jgi:phospho-N-acetylmuramoyl-pentapeptide-transferase|nr:phospho-N-acetylmuramoyl-pentapeptide-transferase [Clostridia bacterium]